MSERKNERTNAQLLAAGLKECPICNYCWGFRGFNRHYNSCKSRSESRQNALRAVTNRQSASGEAANLLYPTLENQHSISVFAGSVPQLLETIDLPAEAQLRDELHNDLLGTRGEANELGIENATDSTLNSSGQTARVHAGLIPAKSQPNDQAPEGGDIRVLHYPRPNRCQDKLPTAASLMRPIPQARPMFFHGKLAPWAPFQSRADFRFARNALKGGLTKDEVNEFLDIHHLSKDSPVSFKDYDELQTIQNRAAHRLASASFYCI